MALNLTFNMRNEIQTIEITTDTFIRLKFNTSNHKKDTYIYVGELIRLLDEDMKRLSDLPENKDDKEKYIRSLLPGQDRPSWL
jgi:hypothetical protein